MEESHEYQITLSPEGQVQVATARCSCGWQEKVRNLVGAPPVTELAMEAGEVHVADAAQASNHGVAPTAAVQSARVTDPADNDSPAHSYTLLRPPGVPAFFKCSCGWVKTAQIGAGATVEKEARDCAVLHVEFRNALEAGAPVVSDNHAPHTTEVRDVVAGCEATCSCGSVAQFETREEAFRWGISHEERVGIEPEASLGDWIVGLFLVAFGVLMAVGLIAIIVSGNLLTVYFGVGAVVGMVAATIVAGQTASGMAAFVACMGGLFLWPVLLVAVVVSRFSPST